MTEELDKYILDIQEVSELMYKLSKHILESTSVAQYKFFLENSVDGVDCGYVVKSKRKFYNKEEEGLLEQLEDIYSKLGEILEHNDQSN